MREFQDEVAAPVAPRLVRAVMAPLASLAEHRGLDGRYERYHQVLVTAVGQRPLLVQPRAAATAAG